MKLKTFFTTWSIKKITALLGFVGLILGVAGGGWALFKDYHGAAEKKKQINFHLSVADQIAEVGDLKKAIATYRQVLTLDNENEQALRKIIKLSRQQLHYNYRHFNHPEFRRKAYPIVIDLISSNSNLIYEFRAIFPDYQNDLELALEEIMMVTQMIFIPERQHLDNLLLYHIYRKEVETYLKNAHRLAKALYSKNPDDPDVLAQYALTTALQKNKNYPESIQLLEQAMALSTNNWRYAYFFAKVTDLQRGKKFEYEPSALAYLNVIKSSGLETGLPDEILYECKLFANYRIRKALGRQKQLNQITLTQAIEILEQAPPTSQKSYEFNPTSSNIHYLAALYLELGDTTHAEMLLSKHINAFTKLEGARPENIITGKTGLLLIKPEKIIGTRSYKEWIGPWVDQLHHIRQAMHVSEDSLTDTRDYLTLLEKYQEAKK